ncbi:MAG: hypothetical protein R3B99_05245 [Polyangiales bacterium]
MRQGLVFLSCVWALAVGCKSEPLGVEGWAEAQRAAAESVCGCASALGRSVESCFEDYDTSEYGESYVCVEEGLAVEPEAIAHIDCVAESFWKLDRCTSSDSCEEDKVERCIDQHEVRVLRCPSGFAVFGYAQQLCIDRIVIRANAVTRYVDAVQLQFGTRTRLPADWRTCVQTGFRGERGRSSRLRDRRAPCPHIDRYNECVRTGDDCQRLLTPTSRARAMPQELLDWQATCFELD